ncbi:uncharacterized protein PADG_11757 [Paracoccidioides brasiliensis Pb18]|uniref:Uncharacterized protein n=1 Tax=Paracoccidioides brasiliensis (strain Pb18) TaxID=502780 RepID=A0A0A0HSS6_PARBD|nr:uncharacterized protein PADG_11757 [Paracoccidioides brasiliensis Pb18]KGM92219.1 hypothetical protein PADG_11757 [Paracoccidioides brasiliensis Pb18]
MSCHINDAIFSKINHRTNLPRDNYSPLTVRLRPFINRAIWDDIHTQRFKRESERAAKKDIQKILFLPFVSPHPNILSKSLKVINIAA